MGNTQSRLDDRNVERSVLARVAWWSATLGLVTAACEPTISSGDSGSQTGGGGSGGSGVADGGTGGVDAESGTGNDAGLDAGDPGLPDGAIVTVPLFSCVPTIYTAAVTIGSAQTFQLLVDTGSTTLGVAASSCTSCGVEPVYKPGSTAVDQNEQADAEYGLGSWQGEVYQDAVSAGAAPDVSVDVVAIDAQSQFFEPIACDSKSGGSQGILGLGPSAAALQGTTGYFDQLLANEPLQDIFATRLCDSGGTLWLGGYDPTMTTAAPVYTDETGSSRYYYSVNLASITVAGTSVPVPTPSYKHSIVDTGTSVFMLSTAAFNAITAAIAASPNFASLFGSDASWFSSLGNCQPLSQTKAEIDAALPPLTLVFGTSPSISVQASATESYLVPYQGAWCPALLAQDPTQGTPFAAIMGSPVLRSNVVIFDRANSRIGFAPHAPCP
jgi:hypothetical protein